MLAAPARLDESRLIPPYDRAHPILAGEFEKLGRLSRTHGRKRSAGLNKVRYFEPSSTAAPNSESPGCQVMPEEAT